MQCSLASINVFKAISSGQNMKAAGYFKILVPITSLHSIPPTLMFSWFITHKATFFIAAHFEKQI